MATNGIKYRESDDMFVAYRRTRLREMGLAVAGIVVVGILILFLFGPMPDDWRDILYGINRIYLFLLVVFVVAFLIPTFRYLTNSDKKKIMRLIEEHPDSSFDVLCDLQEGMLVAPHGADSFCVAPHYCLIRCHGKYHLVKCTDVLRLGCEQQYILGNARETMICLLKSGQRFELNFPHTMALAVAEQLNKAVTNR